jgi:Mg2+ and Co2+ transporter CorA
MADHVTRLNELVVTTVGHANNNANLTLALLGTIFLPLTWIAGGCGLHTLAFGTAVSFWMSYLCCQEGFNVCWASVTV